jgi:cell division protein FtsB
MAPRNRRRTGIDDVILVPMSPSRQRRTRLIAVLVSLVAAAALFTGGLWLGHGGGLDSSRQNQVLRQTLDKTQALLRTARHELALYKAEVDVAEQAREKLRKEIRGLRDQSAELEEAVAFYKNVMAPGDNNGPLQIQKFDVRPADGERRYRYRLVLVQSGDNRGYLSGAVTLSLKGQRDGKAVTLDAAPWLDESSELRFRFRYFQALSGILTVPADLQVNALEMKARSTGGRRSEVVQSFPLNPIE